MWSEVWNFTCLPALAIVLARSPVADAFANWAYGRALRAWRVLSNMISDPPTVAFAIGLATAGDFKVAGAAGLIAFVLDGLVAILYSIARRIDRPGDPPPGHGQMPAQSRPSMLQEIDKRAPPTDLTENEAFGLLDESDDRRNA